MKANALASLLFSGALVVTGGGLVHEGLTAGTPPETPKLSAPVVASGEQRPAGPTAAPVAPLDAELSLEEPSPVAPATPALRPEAMEAGTLFIPGSNTYARVDTSFGQIEAGVLTLPPVPRVTLWKEGARLDSTQGNLIIAGHVSMGQRRGSLYDLTSLQPGHLAYLKDEEGRTGVFQLEAMESLHKEKLPAELWRTGGPKRLVIITCGGELLRGEDGSYAFEDNLVATFKPVP